jgi:anti-anti-sigma regulatory factor
VSAVPLLRAQLRAVALTWPRRPVIDTAGITFIDCAAARVLIAAVGGRPDWGRPVMRCPSPAVRLVLELTGLADQCEISG